MNKVDFDNMFLMTEDIPTCPNCGSRTNIILDFSHMKDSIQILKCLSMNCKMEFVLVADSSFDKN